MKKGYDFVRIVGIIIIIWYWAFFGGYGIMQSQIDDQKEFKGVKKCLFLWIIEQNSKLNSMM